MAHHPRGTALAAGLLAVVLGGDVPGVAGQPAGSLTERGHDTVWVGPGHGAARIRITGSVRAPLRPGVSAPVRIGLLNTTMRPVRIRRVRVFIDGITAPHADARHPCTAEDFEVLQMRRGVLEVPAGRYVDLTALRVPVPDWPQLTMRNRPVNQDGCKGASLTLRYRARHEVRRWTT